jgi:hypothetical protein
VLPATPSVSELSQVITQAIVPAFLLGALAAFISLLILRMNCVIDRSQALNAIGDADAARTYLKADLPRLKQRSILLNAAILYAAVSAIFATLLVMVAFVSAFFGVEHERGIAALFVITLGFFAAALINFARQQKSAGAFNRTIGLDVSSAFLCRSACQGETVQSHQQSVPALNLQRYQPCEQGRRIKLTNYRFQVAETACYRMNWKYIAIAG